MSHPSLSLTGILYKEGTTVCALCPELDVASHGATLREAKAMLNEAVSGYLETCFESNLPFLRPVSPEDDPRIRDKRSVLKTFRMALL